MTVAMAGVMCGSCRRGTSLEISLVLCVGRFCMRSRVVG